MICLGANYQQLSAMFRMINKVKPLSGAVRMRDLNSTMIRSWDLNSTKIRSWDLTSATKIQSIRTVTYYSTNELPSKIFEQKTPPNDSKF